MRKQKRPTTPPPIEHVDDPLEVAADAVRRAREALERQESAIAGIRQAGALIAGAADQMRRAPRPAPIRLASVLFGALRGPVSTFDRAALQGACAVLLTVPGDHRVRTLDDLIQALTACPSSVLEEDVLDPGALLMEACCVKDVEGAINTGLVQLAELGEIISAALPEIAAAAKTELVEALEAYERLDEALAPLRAELRVALLEGAALTSPEWLADRLDPSLLLGTAAAGAALAAGAGLLRRRTAEPGARRALSTAGKLGAGTAASLTGALLVRRFWRARQLARRDRFVEETARWVRERAREARVHELDREAEEALARAHTALVVRGALPLIRALIDSRRQPDAGGDPE